jgi:hypothetical protein
MTGHEDSVLVSSNIAMYGVTPSVNYGLAPAQTVGERDSAEFPQTAELSRRLHALSDVRNGAVERGKELSHQSLYPPPYAIIRLARLLAMNLNLGNEFEAPRD